MALLFLRLGAIGFGGPAAHIALMQDEVVRRRQWLTQQEFLDLLGATNLIPGPNSTELAIHIGHRRAGWAGLAVAGVAFILPAAFIVTAFAWMYTEYGSTPQASAVLYGVKPAIVAVVVQALVALGVSAVRNPQLASLGAACVLAAALGADELLVLFGAGILYCAASGFLPGASALLTPVFLLKTAAAAVAQPFGLVPLFLFFVKVGSVLFGSGYVLLAFLRADLVENWRWLTEAQLLDAIAVGQVTPGPLFTTATFVGYLLGGTAGAVVATIGIFLPAFFFVAVSGPLIPRLRKSRHAGAFLDGVNVASLALMSVVTWQVGQSAIVDAPTLLILVASAVALLRYRLNSVWLVAGGAMLGLLLQFL